MNKYSNLLITVAICIAIDYRSIKINITNKNKDNIY